MAREDDKQLTFWDETTNAKLEYLRGVTERKKKATHPTSQAKSRKAKGKRMIDRIDEMKKLGGVETVKKMLESAETLAQLEGGDEMESVRAMIKSAEMLSRLGGPEGAREVIKAQETLDSAWAEFRRALEKSKENEGDDTPLAD